MKTLTIEALANHLNGKLWVKGALKRIYLNNVGNNTKKMSTKTFVYETHEGKFEVSCTIDCPSQHSNWIEKEEQAIIANISEKVAEIIDEHGVEVEPKTTTPIEVVINNAILDAEPVQGYYIEWRSVRVPINRFGKLVNRNRQFVVAFKGTKNTAPRDFVPLSEAAYVVLQARGGEEMLEPYTSVPDYEAIASRTANAN
jgi:hypothetical protein